RLPVSMATATTAIAPSTSAERMGICPPIRFAGFYSLAPSMTTCGSSKGILIFVPLVPLVVPSSLSALISTRMLTCERAAAQRVHRRDPTHQRRHHLGSELRGDEVDVPVLSPDYFQCHSLRDFFN